MNKVTKKLQKFIDSISTIGDSDIPDDDGKVYYSKVDGSYLTRVGMENEVKYLLKYGITEQIQSSSPHHNIASIGFNPIEQKWYGWSHRAIFGFGIGGECKKGMCHYVPSNKEEFMEDELRFWGDTDMEDTHKLNPTVRETTQDGELGTIVEYTYSDNIPNKSNRGKIGSMFTPYPSEWGKGEWTATTLEEAKEMAIDFSNGVS
jgi:hypothetical protein